MTNRLPIFHGFIKSVFFRVFFLGAVIFYNGRLTAHPHVFIDPEARFVFKKKFLSYIRVTWIFDEMTSLNCLEAFDRNKNGRLDKAEINHVRKKIFPNLARYGYYIRMEIDGKKWGRIRPEKFTGTYTKQKRLVYRFFVPVKKTVRRKIRFYFNDDTIFTAFSLKKKHVSFYAADSRPRIRVAAEDYIDVVYLEFD